MAWCAKILCKHRSVCFFWKDPRCIHALFNRLPFLVCFKSLVLQHLSKKASADTIYLHYSGLLPYFRVCAAHPAPIFCCCFLSNAHSHHFLAWTQYMLKANDLKRWRSIMLFFFTRLILPFAQPFPWLTTRSNDFFVLAQSVDTHNDQEATPRSSECGFFYLTDQLLLRLLEKLAASVTVTVFSEAAGAGSVCWG